MLRNQADRSSEMNRRKKIKQLLQAHAKKASAKLAPRKPKYICKADRLRMEAEAAGDAANAPQG